MRKSHVRELPPSTTNKSGMDKHGFSIKSKQSKSRDVGSGSVRSSAAHKSKLAPERRQSAGAIKKSPDEGRRNVSGAARIFTMSLNDVGLPNYRTSLSDSFFPGTTNKTETETISRKPGLSSHLRTTEGTNSNSGSKEEHRRGYSDPVRLSSKDASCSVPGRDAAATNIAEDVAYGGSVAKDGDCRIHRGSDKTLKSIISRTEQLLTPTTWSDGESVRRTEKPEDGQKQDDQQKSIEKKPKKKAVKKQSDKRKVGSGDFATIVTSGDKTEGHTGTPKLKSVSPRNLNEMPPRVLARRKWSESSAESGTIPIKESITKHTRKTSGKVKIDKQTTKLNSSERDTYKKSNVTQPSPESDWDIDYFGFKTDITCDASISESTTGDCMKPSIPSGSSSISSVALCNSNRTVRNRAKLKEVDFGVNKSISKSGSACKKTIHKDNSNTILSGDDLNFISDANVFSRDDSSPESDWDDLPNNNEASPEGRTENREINPTSVTPNPIETVTNRSGPNLSNSSASDWEVGIFENSDCQRDFYTPPDSRTDNGKIRYTNERSENNNLNLQKSSPAENHNVSPHSISPASDWENDIPHFKDKPLDVLPSGRYSVAQIDVDRQKSYSSTEKFNVERSLSRGSTIPTDTTEVETELVNCSISVGNEDRETSFSAGENLTADSSRMQVDLRKCSFSAGNEDRCKELHLEETPEIDNANDTNHVTSSLASSGCGSQQPAEVPPVGRMSARDDRHRLTSLIGSRGTGNRPRMQQRAPFASRRRGGSRASPRHSERSRFGTPRREWSDCNNPPFHQAWPTRRPPCSDHMENEETLSGDCSRMVIESPRQPHSKPSTPSDHIYCQSPDDSPFYHSSKAIDSADFPRSPPDSPWDPLLRQPRTPNDISNPVPLDAHYWNSPRAVGTNFYRRQPESPWETMSRSSERSLLSTTPDRSSGHTPPQRRSRSSLSTDRSKGSSGPTLSPPSMPSPPDCSKDSPGPTPSPRSKSSPSLDRARCSSGPRSSPRSMPSPSPDRSKGSSSPKLSQHTRPSLSWRSRPPPSSDGPNYPPPFHRSFVRPSNAVSPPGFPPMPIRSPWECQSRPLFSDDRQGPPPVPPPMVSPPGFPRMQPRPPWESRPIPLPPPDHLNRPPLNYPPFPNGAEARIRADFPSKPLWNPRLGPCLPPAQLFNRCVQEAFGPPGHISPPESHRIDNETPVKCSTSEDRLSSPWDPREYQVPTGFTPPAQDMPDCLIPRDEYQRHRSARQLFQPDAQGGSNSLDRNRATIDGHGRDQHREENSYQSYPRDTSTTRGRRYGQRQAPTVILKPKLRSRQTQPSSQSAKEERYFAGSQEPICMEVEGKGLTPGMATSSENLSQAVPSLDNIPPVGQDNIVPASDSQENPSPIDYSTRPVNNENRQTTPQSFSNRSFADGRAAPVTSGTSRLFRRSSYSPAKDEGQSAGTHDVMIYSTARSPTDTVTSSCRKREIMSDSELPRTTNQINSVWYQSPNPEKKIKISDPSEKLADEIHSNQHKRKLFQSDMSVINDNTVDLTNKDSLVTKDAVTTPAYNISVPNVHFTSDMIVEPSRLPAKPSDCILFPCVTTDCDVTFTSLLQTEINTSSELRSSTLETIPEDPALRLEDCTPASDFAFVTGSEATESVSGNAQEVVYIAEDLSISGCMQSVNIVGTDTTSKPSSDMIIDGALKENVKEETMHGVSSGGHTVEQDSSSVVLSNTSDHSSVTSDGLRAKRSARLSDDKSRGNRVSRLTPGSVEHRWADENNRSSRYKQLREERIISDSAKKESIFKRQGSSNQPPNYQKRSTSHSLEESLSQTESANDQDVTLTEDTDDVFSVSAPPVDEGNQFAQSRKQPRNKYGRRTEKDLNDANTCITSSETDVKTSSETEAKISSETEVSEGEITSTSEEGEIDWFDGVPKYYETKRKSKSLGSSKPESQAPSYNTSPLECNNRFGVLSCLSEPLGYYGTRLNSTSIPSSRLNKVSRFSPSPTAYMPPLHSANSSPWQSVGAGGYRTNRIAFSDSTPHSHKPFVFTPTSVNNITDDFSSNWRRSKLGSNISPASDSELLPKGRSRFSDRWGDWKEKFQQRYRCCEEPFIDTHCHLDFLFDRSGFKGSFEDYMKKHKDTFLPNFKGCVAIFCNPNTFNVTDTLWVRLLDEDNIWGAVGCHPKSATNFTNRALTNMIKMIMHQKVVAVGEIGLDYSGTFHQHSEVQKDVFEQQLQLALEVNKPIVIHSRDAEEDCIEILEKIVPRNHKIHRHCFTGTWGQCKDWLQKFPNSYIGLTPLITQWQGRAIPVREVAKNIPLDRLVLETDAPYFVPSRIPKEDMEYNHPGMAITVAGEVARLKGIRIDEVLVECRRNTKDLYGI